MAVVNSTHLEGWRFAIAPMMRRTDRHFRYLVRLLSPHARLYTEMITTGAILHGDRQRLLRFDPNEHPVAVQLGGSDPYKLAAAAKIALAYGYDEVNLNCGCPSPHVKSGGFGACLMANPALVADCLRALLDEVPVTVSVKLRLGIDDLYSYAYFRDFVGQLFDAGCRVFQIHARKAVLSGLSPTDNRKIPRLNYAWVYSIKRDFPSAVIILNGGIKKPDSAAEHLKHVDGIMIGRRAYADPYEVSLYQRALFSPSLTVPSRTEIVRRYLLYVERELSRGTKLKQITRHLLNLFRGQPGAKHWRRHLTLLCTGELAGSEVIREALSHIDSADTFRPLSTNALAPRMSATL